jgi:hypothetical protein
MENNKIPHCQNSSNRKTTKYHTWQCGILVFFYWILELSWLWYFVVFHGCWNCPDSVVFCYFS